MKSLILKIVSSKVFATLFLRPLLILDGITYKLISILVIQAENGTHPKKKIIRYEDWFISQVSKDATVLDIGCNTGELLNQLAPKVKKAIGLEISQKHIEKANLKNKHENLEFIQADATKFDFNEIEKPDFIILSNVLEHIDNRLGFLSSIIKNLNNQDTKFLIRVPLITRDWLACYKKQRNIDYRLDNTHYIEYEEGEIEKELRDSGLNIIEHNVKFGEFYSVCEIKGSHG